VHPPLALEEFATCQCLRYEVLEETGWVKVLRG